MTDKTKTRVRTCAQGHDSDGAMSLNFEVHGKKTCICVICLRNHFVALGFELTEQEKEKQS